MFLRSPYKAAHAENRMQHEGDVTNAREHYYHSGNKNLRFLLERRFRWMNRFIQPSDRGVEVGCGTGISKDFIKAREYLVTDFADHPWLDVKNVDALHTPFADGEFDFVVSSNMIHHVPHPVLFLREMHRILKPGGVLLVQEINASFFMRAILRLMRHEGYSFEVPVFNPEVVCTDPKDLWSANCAIPNLLFDNAAAFEQAVPEFTIEYQSTSEFFTFLNSGGVIAKTKCVPLPQPLLYVLGAIDTVLARLLPGVFALQRQIVLRRNVASAGRAPVRSAVNG